MELTEQEKWVLYYLYRSQNLYEEHRLNEVLEKGGLELRSEKAIQSLFERLLKSNLIAGDDPRRIYSTPEGLNRVIIDTTSFKNEIDLYDKYWETLTLGQETRSESNSQLTEEKDPVPEDLKRGISLIERSISGEIEGHITSDEDRENSEFSKEQLYLLWYLRRENEYDDSKYPDAMEILRDEYGELTEIKIGAWVLGLKLDGYIETFSTNDYRSRITKRGLLFYEENQSLFEHFSLESAKRDFAEPMEISENDIETKTETKEPKYWLVGSYWGGAEQLDRFILEGIWENGHEDKFSDRVAQVRVGDILFAKSTYGKGGKSQLKIKRFGIVTSKSEGGRVLQVNWRPYVLDLEISGSDFYTDAIQKLREEDHAIVDAVSAAAQIVGKDGRDLKKASVSLSEDNLTSDEDKERIYNEQSLKFALSTFSSSNFLEEEGYTRMGIIGYIDTMKFANVERPVALHSFLLKENHSYFYSTKQDLSNPFKGSAHDYEGPLGIVSLDKTENHDTQIFRYCRNNSLDYIFCTHPKKKKLEDFGYELERDVFAPLYVRSKNDAGTAPLYVYSTRPEFDFFDTLPEPENTSQKHQFDYQSFLWSDSATEEDKLGRESLVKGVTESINKLFEKYQGAYTILLNGEWGSGKSSMLNFFEKHLSNSGWKVIKYNAWENQKFKDPWWILINKISQYASKESLPGEFSSHKYWKYKLQYKHKVWAMILIAIFGVSAYFFASSLDAAPTDGSASKYDFGFYSSLIGLVGTFIGAITGLVNNFFFKSVSHEQLKQQFTEHPFEPIRKRFNQIAEKNNLAIFIDDLDRCDVEATVSLMEGIQNLFKDVRVLYIIAADGQWVSNCFTQKYKDFKTLTNDGCSIGDKFLQKTFQLTLNVPKPSEKYLKLYWDNLIGHEDAKPDAKTNVNQELPKMKSSSQDRQQVYEREINTLNKETEQKLADQKEEFEENIEKYLKQFLDQGVSSNPRQMKRFVNQFEVTRQTLVVEGNIEKYGEDDKTVKFLIFSMRYPSLSDKLKKGEITKEDLFKTDSKQAPFIDLTEKDRADIQELLTDIDEDLIKGDFYSI